MANFFTDNEDLQFYFDKGVDWKSLISLVERTPAGESPENDWTDVKETYLEIVKLLGEFAGNEIAPKAEAMDRQGVHMKDGEVVMSPEHKEIFEGLAEMGVFGICTPPELGGMGAPGLLYLVISEMIGRADVPTMTHMGFHVATALTLMQYSLHEGSTKFDEKGRITETRFGDIISEIIEGKEWGSMDLTEPNAGSDLALLRTKATQDADGVWRVTGNKIFITSGHGKYHLVLAKTDDRESLQALSLFLVPLTFERDGETIKNAWVDRVEEKMGQHGSPTCSVIFDDSEGELIGKEGEGFGLMLKLMNHARLGVGFEGLGMCEAAHRASKDYAAERVSMGLSIDKHPMIADILDDMKTTIVGLRAMAFEAATVEEQTIHLGLQEQSKGKIADVANRRRMRKLKARGRHLTPLLKYMASEEAVRFSRNAMQIHGGNGYTTDYAPERLLRDSLVLPVYEGTSQIQALMALKDNLGEVMKNPQRFMRRLAFSKLNQVRAADPLERGVWRMKGHSYSAQQTILWKVMRNKMSGAWQGGGFTEILSQFKKDWDPKRDFQYGLLHAENLIRILCDAAVTDCLWRQAQKFPERRVHLERWLERAEPRARYHLSLIQSTGDRLLKSLENELPQGSVVEPKQAAS